MYAIITTTPQRYNKICINVLTHERKKNENENVSTGDVSGTAENGNGCGRCTAMHGKTLCTTVKNKNEICTHKNVSRKKKTWNRKKSNERV